MIFRSRQTTVFTSAQLSKGFKVFTRVRKSLATYLKFHVVKGDININVDTLQRKKSPQISGLHETKIELQSMNFFLAHTSLQTCSRTIQFHPSTLNNNSCATSNAWKGNLGCKALTQSNINVFQKLHSFVYLLRTGIVSGNGTK